MNNKIITDSLSNLNKPLISIILPAYNESNIIEHSINSIVNYILEHGANYDWEILLINDGSKDNTGEIANNLSKKIPMLKVIHHPVNLNLGSAMRTGFNHSKGDYVITLDLDLSYSVEHIGLLLDKITKTQADIVIASPYMKGGKVTGVPFVRRAFSRIANRYMSLISQEKYYTFTGMVRAYNGDFIRSLNLKARSAAINPEIIYKGIILRAQIIEIPAHLDWSFQIKNGEKRKSSINLYKSVLSSLMSGFIFRPFVFFLTVGMILFLTSLYIIIWILIQTFQVYPLISGNVEQKFSLAVAEVFKERPYSFIVGGIVMIIAFQFLGIGFLSLQNKRYFEELFHINTSIKNKIKN